MSVVEDELKNKEEKEWPESVQNSLLKILEEIEREDENVRRAMLQECKRNELYWHGFQHIFWDASIQDFRIPTQDIMDEIGSREEIKFLYDYVVNVFKAHGSSIIAALSAEIPGVSFSPVDAESAEDTVASRKAESLGKIIQKHNKSKLLFYHALFILYTNHFVAAYNYYERDEELGTVEIPKIRKRSTKVTPDSYNCPNEDCSFSSEEELINCPNCGEDLDFKEGETKNIPTKVGVENVNLGMEKIKVKGTLNVKIPIYASDQAACGYLIDYTDQHYAWLRKNYKNVDRNKLGPGSSDDYEKLSRMPSSSGMYYDASSQNLKTLKRIWLRPWMYDTLNDTEADELNKHFPKGVYFAAVESGSMVFAEAREERLDDHWNITKGDLSRTVHGDPLGKPLIPLQDLENMSVNLLTESLEHSVPTNFADPEMVDFDLYSKQEVSPGAIYPLKNSLTNPNRRTEDYFYSTKTSTLPPEGVDFERMIESKSQFVVGAFPSIFGGPQTQGSKTLGEYQESRGYALQRLSIPYQLLFFWWSDVIYRSVKDYIINMVSDEKHTINVQDGKFENVQLLMDTFTLGKFRLLVSESATDLPVSFSQKRTTLKDLVQLNSDVLNEFLFSPENRKVTLKFLGMEELSDLDSNQSMKQLLEIEELLKGESITDEMTEIESSSVPIEPDIDDAEIHLRVIKVFASSASGREHKKNNPEGYKNMLLHAREHKMYLEQQMMEQMMQEQQTKQPQDQLTQ